MMKMKLLFIALVASLFLLTDAQRVSTSTTISTAGNIATTWTFTNISLPLLSVVLIVDGTGVSSPTTGNVTYSLASASTGLVLDSSQLQIVPGVSRSIRAIVPPCQIDASDSVTVSIVTDAPVSGLNATLQLQATSSDVYAGDFVIETPLKTSSNTSDEFFYASLSIPDSANYTQYSVNISLQDSAAGSVVPFTSYCLQEGTCTASCLLQGTVSAQSVLVIPFTPVKGENYYLSFAVASSSIGTDSVILTTTAAPVTAGTTSPVGGNTGSSSSSTTTSHGSTTATSGAPATRAQIFLGFLFILCIFLF